MIRRAGIAALGLLLTGCYGTSLGPSFKSVPENPKKTLVYVYRPRAIMGWARPLHVTVGGTERIVMIGGYAVFAVPPGRHSMFAFGTDGSQTYFAHDMGGTVSTSVPKTLDAKPGSSVYLRLRSSLSTIDLDEVPPSEGKSEAEACDLTPGGALR